MFTGMPFCKPVNFLIWPNFVFVRSSGKKGSAGRATDAFTRCIGSFFLWLRAVTRVQKPGLVMEYPPTLWHAASCLPSSCYFPSGRGLGHHFLVLYGGSWYLEVPVGLPVFFFFSSEFAELCRFLAQIDFRRSPGYDMTGLLSMLAPLRKLVAFLHMDEGCGCSRALTSLSHRAPRPVYARHPNKSVQRKERYVGGGFTVVCRYHGSQL
ncbi:hypothetical protein AVEN_186783-1 [Araneus ventricosus]|uniref:Uncharacterized protein n=1 Tax=Araneus ventricosus TaxID=182803 RepID=A0A4Y2UM16_ARAVE|nr:hypothetical protein AVEN_186783-1 [Araneus ventricosus]